MKYISNALWPKGTFPGGSDHTSDMHDSREQAQGVCDLLHSRGGGVLRHTFPLRTWVSEQGEPQTPEAATPLTDKLKFQYYSEGGGWVVAVEDVEQLERELQAVTAERDKLSEIRAKFVLNHIGRICGECGHDKDEDGHCANCLRAELAYVTLQRDSLLEMTWLDLPSEPSESTHKWKLEFEKGWCRRAELSDATAERDTARAESAKLREVLEKLSRYDEEPIWWDDRGDAADSMRDLASEALAATVLKEDSKP